jgi:hypothetical protein
MAAANLNRLEMGIFLIIDDEDGPSKKKPSGRDPRAFVISRA